MLSRQLVVLHGQLQPFLYRFCFLICSYFFSDVHEVWKFTLHVWWKGIGFFRCSDNILSDDIDMCTHTGGSLKLVMDYLVYIHYVNQYATYQHLIEDKIWRLKCNYIIIYIIACTNALKYEWFEKNTKPRKQIRKHHTIRVNIVKKNNE